MKIHIVYLTWLNIICRIQTLVELPKVEDNNIAITEKVIRNTVNQLFSSFKVKDVKNKPRLKQLSLIHNFFVSITLTDFNNLKKIARLAQVVNTDNETQNFITKINEVLNDDGDKIDESNDGSELYVLKYIETSIDRFRKLKETYVGNKTTINADILKYLQNDGNKSANETDFKNKGNLESEDVLSDSDFWRPDGRRIVQGIRTYIKRFPFMASIHVFKKFQCAGSIIQNDLVITSASCLQIAWNNRFFRENPSFLSVQVGSDYYEGSGEIIAVLEIFFHPEYEPNFLKNNLAIMRLTRKISFKNSKKRIKMIDFDRTSSEMPVNCPKITVVGWGATDSKNIVYDVFKNKLSYIELDHYPLSDCQEHYSKGFVTRKNFCAGFYSKPGGACNRDAGGPGIVQDMLMGVLSFGSPLCGTSDSPTVFTKLGFYTDWIESIMEQAPPSKYHQTTTLPPKTLYSLPFTYKVTKRRITPIGPIPDNYVPKPIHEMDALRAVQDQGLKDFLAVMFRSSKNVTDDDDVSETDPKDENNDDQPNETLELTEVTTKMINPTLQLTPKMDEDTKSVLRNRKPVHTKSKDKKAVLETGNNDGTSDEDIMAFIDKLDIDELLHNFSLGRNDVMKNNKSLKVEINMDVSNESGEDHNVTRSLQRYIFTDLFSSKDSTDGSNEKDEGLSIPIQTNANKTPENRTSLFELVSLAIEEESMALRKKKRYIF